jgi:hypothetical protein
MIYDITIPTMRQKLIQDAALEGDDCPVDEICDSIPSIIKVVNILEGKLRDYKNNNAKISADLLDAERKINNLKSQKERRNKKNSRRRG